MTENRLKFLIVEDLPTDAEICIREVKKVLPDSDFRVVETREAFLKELEVFRPDLILSDFSLPTFDGLEALRLTIEHSPQTPLIIVTGSVNEETAVECMRAGAVNYVIKEHRARLGTTIIHALEEKREKAEKKQAEDALRESNKLNKSLLQTIPFGMEIVDENGTILFQSESLINMIGGNTIGQKCWKIYRDDKLQCPDCPLKTGISEGITDIIETYSVLGGRIFQISHTGMIFQGKKAMLEIFQDITGRKLMEKELIAARDKAEENDRLKTAFLNNISHEIRTPLNGIVGFVNLLNDPGISASDREHFIGIINNSSERLVETINDIIGMSMIETGQEVIREKPFDLNELMEKVFFSFSIKIKDPELSFKFRKTLTSEQALILSDESKLFQILYNLIGNALKFTAKGSVEFMCSIDNEFLVFAVTDTGIGINPEDQPFIFNQFWKSKPEGNRLYQGTGLGLSICLAYVNMLGGKIWVESAKGQGSVFRFTLPYIPAAKIRSTPAPGLYDRPDGSILKTIMVAEDEYDNFLYTEILLKQMNIEIIHAWDGKEAIDICRKNDDIDLVLMDLKMPGTDGYEATKEIKSFRPGIPVIAITAYALTGDREKALGCGCDDYLPKPFTRELLLEKFRKFNLIKKD